MRRTIVMPVDGILRKPVGGQVNEDGLRLYWALHSEYGVLLVVDGDKDRTLDWLEKEGITGYDDLIVYASLRVNITESFWVNILRHLRMRGYDLALCVVNDPESAMAALDRHVPVLMYSQPSYGLPEWLPGAGRPSEDWAALSGKVNAERLARMNDKRMEGRLE